MSCWRDRTREVDFVVHMAGRLELVQAKSTQLRHAWDTVNLAFAQAAIKPLRGARAIVACPAPNAYPLGDGLMAMPAADLLKVAT